jgi:nicotinate phosphoribosyltransferase
MNKFVPSPEVLSGKTADVYFLRTLDILKKENVNPFTVMEFFPGRPGVFCGIEEVKALLQNVLPAGNAEAWAIPEGESMETKEVVLRIKAPYQSYGMYETALCGMLAHPSGWATAAREVVQAAGNIPVISFGGRHVHPAVAGIMDYAAVKGGCQGCSTVSGARLSDIIPSGTIPHALVLLMGDTVKAAKAFDKHMPEDIARIALVDTFKDEAEESLRVAYALGEKLAFVRLDTPRERGGVTIDLVKELRARLDLEGFRHVKIFVTGGLDVSRIRQFVSEKAPVDGFGVGSYISGAPPIDFTADLHEIDGKPVAKRGRIPGITDNPRLQRFI